MTMLRQLQLWDLGNVEQRWSVRQSTRARRLSVRVFRNGGVEIVVPPRTSPNRVNAFVSEHREWIERQRERAVPQVDWPMPPVLLSLSGIAEDWHCQTGSDLGRLRLHETGDGAIELRGPRHDHEQVRHVFMRWLLQHAAARFEPLLHDLAAHMGVSADRVQIRCQRTRWGSCSRSATVSLNVCLLFQRPEVLRYLMIHELAHLRQMNHSSRFWAEVARYEPEWKALDRELQQGWRRVPTWIFR